MFAVLNLSILNLFILSRLLSELFVFQLSCAEIWNICVKSKFIEHSMMPKVLHGDDWPFQICRNFNNLALFGLEKSLKLALEFCKLEPSLAFFELEFTEAFFKLELAEEYF